MRLALKYRPARLEEVMGHKVLITLLSRALATGTLGQTLLLTGSYGVGKTSLARLMAKSLTCLTPLQGQACGICLSCQAFDKKNHSDIQEIDAASHTGIDDVRLILEGLPYKPLMGRAKVIILDEVHMLSKSAFNALLKTLEEPEPHVVFILATTESEKIPPTILSRCQHFALKPVILKDMLDHLSDIAAREGRLIEHEALILIALHGQGSVRDAVSLLEQSFLLTDQTVTLEAVEALLGLPEKQAIDTLLSYLWQGQAAQAVDLVRHLQVQGKTPDAILSALLQDIHQASHSVLRGQTPGSLAQWDRLWQVTLRGTKEVQESPMPSLALEMLVMRLAYMGTFPTPDQLVLALEGATRQEDNNISEKTSQKMSQSTSERTPEIKSEIPLTLIRLLSELKSQREGLLHAHLVQHAGFISWNEETLCLSGIKEDKISQDLERFLHRWLGRPHKVVWSDQGTLSLRDHVQAHPLWQEAKKLFPGAVLTQVEPL